MLGLRWFGRSASYEAVMAARVTIGGSDPVKSAAVRGESLETALARDGACSVQWRPDF